VRSEQTTDVRPTLDGRRARRERGRLAVIDAIVDLVFEGELPPSAERIAERAGVSVASIFRYFETLDEMRRVTAQRYFDRYAELFAIPDIGEGTLAERIDRFVAARVRLHETTEPMARFARLRSAEHDTLADTLRLVRATRADQVRLQFDPELSSMPRAARDDVVATVSTLTSFEAWEHFRHDHARSGPRIHRAWSQALHRMLDGGPDAGR
jgi:AcrR family transcriptional regulator